MQATGRNLRIFQVDIRQVPREDTGMTQSEEAAKLYAEGMQVQAIAKQLGKTRQTIWTWLKYEGVPRRAYSESRTCESCGATFRRLVSRNRPVRAFCGASCYRIWRWNPAFKQWRHGTRLARLAVLDSGFDLRQGMVVHHVNGDESDNELVNLVVFASASDHMKHHHGISPVAPIWEGKRYRR